MKKILVAILAITLISSTALAANGEKKKARKKAKTESTKKCPAPKSCQKESECCFPGCCSK